MRSYSNYSYVSFSGTVTPEDSVRARGMLLSVRHENFLVFLVRVGDGRELVGLQARMPRVLLQHEYALANLLEKPLVPGCLSAFGLFSGLQ